MIKNDCDDSKKNTPSIPFYLSLATSSFLN
jgi:hypothetical protein